MGFHIYLLPQLVPTELLACMHQYGAKKPKVQDNGLSLSLRQEKTRSDKISLEGDKIFLPYKSLAKIFLKK